MRNKRNISAETEPRQGWVYFIRNGKAIKIGFTTDLDQRLRKLQTASSTPLEVMGSIPGTIQDEQNLHRRFYNLNVHGEWFRGHPSLMAYIREATKAPEPVVEIEPAEPAKPLSAEAKAAISALLKRRNRVGRLSREGMLLSNLIEQTPWTEDTTDPRPWAQHPTQNLPWIMQRQIEALAKEA
jgi:T5orf172 domain.